MKAPAQYLPRNQLGLAVLHWPSHIAALQVRWLTRYLDPTRGTWKLVLDAWFADRFAEGRGAVFSTISIKHMTEATVEGAVSALPEFWKDALTALRGMHIELIKPYEDMPPSEAKSIPLFTNPLFKVRLADSPLADDWKTDLELHRVGDTFNNETGFDYTREQLIRYVEQAFPEENGRFLLRKNWYGRDLFIRLWGELLDDIPQALFFAALGRTAAPALGETRPVYSPQAQSMMHSMG
jgi:hypothetical protein